MVLSKRGIESEFAEDGQQGVDCIRENEGKFDMIFMDNTMPIMVSVFTHY